MAVTVTVQSNVTLHTVSSAGVRGAAFENFVDSPSLTTETPRSGYQLSKALYTATATAVPEHSMGEVFVFEVKPYADAMNQRDFDFQIDVLDGAHDTNTGDGTDDIFGVDTGTTTRPHGAFGSADNYISGATEANRRVTVTVKPPSALDFETAPTADGRTAYTLTVVTRMAGYAPTAAGAVSEFVQGIPLTSYIVIPVTNIDEPRTGAVAASIEENEADTGEVFPTSLRPVDSG